jgi:eukaryotic-like serine/threonine-protein kinase
MLNEPVEACPPSALYRFRKFVSHHRVAFTTGSLVTAAVLVGLITSVSLAVRADRERRRAEAAFVEAEASRKSELEQRQAVSKERDEAQRQRDQVTGLNQTLRDHQEQQRRIAYTRDMRLVQASWNAGNVDQVRELLASHRAKPDEQDLRGFEWHYWNRQANAESRTFQIPRGNARVISAAISSDGSRIAQVVNSQVTIWSVEAGRPLRTITLPLLPRESQTQFLGASEKNLAIAWDATYPADASFSMSKQLQVFDVETGKSLYSIHEPLGLLATSPDGSRLAAIVRAEGKSKWALKIWDADTGNVLIENPLADYPNEIAVGPQATRIAMSYYEPSRVEVMTLDQSSEIITLGLDKPVSRLMQFSADGTRLAISQSDDIGIEYVSDIIVYDLSDPNAIRPPQVFRDGSGYGLALSADGCYLAYELPDSAAIQIVSLSDGRPLATLYGHARAVRHVAFSSDAKRLISADFDGTVREWKLPAVADLNVGSMPDMLALAPDQSRIAVVPSATSVTSSSEENVPTANRVTVLGLQGQGTLLLPPLDGPITQGDCRLARTVNGWPSLRVHPIAN